MSLSLPWSMLFQRAKRRTSAKVKASPLTITQMIMTSVRLSWETSMETISISSEERMENLSVVCSSTLISTTTSIKAPNRLFWRQIKKVLFILEISRISDTLMPHQGLHASSDHTRRPGYSPRLATWTTLTTRPSLSYLKRRWDFPSSILRLSQLTSSFSRLAKAVVPTYAIKFRRRSS